jgi:hypothetical protein
MSLERAQQLMKRGLISPAAARKHLGNPHHDARGRFASGGSAKPENFGWFYSRGGKQRGQEFSKPKIANRYRPGYKPK